MQTIETASEKINFFLSKRLQHRLIYLIYVYNKFYSCGANLIINKDE